MEFKNHAESNHSPIKYDGSDRAKARTFIQNLEELADYMAVDSLCFLWEMPLRSSAWSSTGGTSSVYIWRPGRRFAQAFYVSSPAVT